MRRSKLRQKSYSSARRAPSGPTAARAPASVHAARVLLSAPGETSIKMLSSNCGAVQLADVPNPPSHCERHVASFFTDKMEEMSYPVQIY